MEAATGKERNIVVFYDDPCIDGAASAWAICNGFKDKKGVNIEYVPLGHGRPEDDKHKVIDAVKDGAEVIFVDTSPTDTTLDALLKPGEDAPKIDSLTVIDHHASEVGRLEAYKKKMGKRKKGQPDFQLHLDVDKPSAASFAWEIFNGNKPAPKLLEWVGKMEPPVSLKTNRDYAIASYIDSKDVFSSTEQAFATLDELAATDEAVMVGQGNAILADQLNNTKGLKNAIRYANIELLPGVTQWMPIVNANVQDFGRRINEALLEQAGAGATCGVIGAWHVEGKGDVKLSLRTNGVPNAGLVAKHLGETIGNGGGGHPTDAAMQFESMEQFVANVKTCSRQEMLEQIWSEAERAVVSSSHADAVTRNGAHKRNGNMR